MFFGVLSYDYKFNFPFIDRLGDEYLDNSLAKAVTTYAIVRSSNAVISVLQNTSLDLPLINVGVGQLLDPVDDALERLSSLLVLSIATLGFMKISFIVIKDLYIKLLAFLSLAFMITLWIEKFKPYSKKIIRIILIASFIRFVIPIAGYLNEYIYTKYIEPPIKENQAIIRDILNLKENEEKLQSFLEIEEKDEEGFWNIFETGKNFISNSIEKAKYFKDLLVNIYNHKNELLEAILFLTLYYLTYLLLQVIFIPLGIAWIGMKFFNYMFNKKLTFEEAKINIESELNDIN